MPDFVPITPKKYKKQVEVQNHTQSTGCTSVSKGCPIDDLKLKNATENLPGQYGPKHK